jgi:hypothetical protein
MPDDSSDMPRSKERHIDQRLTTELNGDVSPCHLNRGDKLYIRVGKTTGCAAVTEIVPHAHCVVIDVTQLDRKLSCDRVMLGSGVDFLPDTHTDGHHVEVLAVPVDSGNASYGSECTHVACDCWTVCKEGRGYSIHYTRKHADSLGTLFGSD